MLSLFKYVLRMMDTMFTSMGTKVKKWWSGPILCQKLDLPCHTPDKTPEDMYFKDGRRRVDYVIVFKLKKNSANPIVEEWKKAWRNNFITGIAQQGLEIETTDEQVQVPLGPRFPEEKNMLIAYIFSQTQTVFTQSKAREKEEEESVTTATDVESVESNKKPKRTSKYSFIYVHAPWNTLTKAAEEMALRKPLKPDELKKVQRTRSSEYFLSEFDESSEDEDKQPSPGKQQTYFTSPFSCARQAQFHIEGEETFFDPAERSMLVHHILSRTVFSKSSAKVGVDELERLGAIKASFPLHSQEVGAVFDVAGLLRGPKWSNFGERFRRGEHRGNQSLNKVRDYFGDAIGFFFCWMSFSTNMLVPLIAASSFVFIFGIVYIDDYITYICEETLGGHLSQCPDREEYNPYCLNKETFLKESYCDIMKMTRFFNNYASVFNAVFSTVWAFVFLKLWVRRSAVLQVEWKVRDYKTEEVLRPQYCNLKRERRPHPITGELEPFIGAKEKYTRILSSMFVVLLMIGVVIVATWLTYMFDNFSLCNFFDGFSATNSELISSSASALVSLLCVVVLKEIFWEVCKLLTDIEMHRTESDWTNHFRFKHFLVCFVISNAAPVAYVLHFIEKRGTNTAGYDISFLIIVYMVGEPVVLFVMNRIKLAFYEITFKKKTLMNLGKNDDAEDLRNSKTHAEDDFLLLKIPDQFLTDHYSETVLQFGFVTMYAAVFPLAAICAALKNVLTMWYLSYNFSRKWRRPVAQRAQDIGIYSEIVRVISYISIFTNAHILAWHTQLIPRLVYWYYFQGGDADERFHDYQDFFLEEHKYPGTYSNKTCVADYRLLIGAEEETDETTFLLNFTAKWSLTFEIVFLMSMAVVARLIEAFPNIPENEKIDLLKERYVAKKVLQDYITRGSETPDRRGSGIRRKSIFPGHDLDSERRFFGFDISSRMSYGNNTDDNSDVSSSVDDSNYGMSVRSEKVSELAVERRRRHSLTSEASSVDVRSSLYQPSVSSSEEKVSKKVSTGRRMSQMLIGKFQDFLSPSRNKSGTGGGGGSTSSVSTTVTWSKAQLLAEQEKERENWLQASQQQMAAAQALFLKKTVSRH